jgi:hypothetical protein
MQCIFSNLLRFTPVALLLALGTSPGCSSRQPPAASAASAGTAANVDRETWEIYTIQGTRVGYGRTAVKQGSEGAGNRLQIEGLQHLSLKRFNERTEQEMSFSSSETGDGRLIEFQSEIRQGAVPLRTTGRVAGDRLLLETTTQGQRQPASIPWSAEYGGFSAVEQSLLRKPMQPDERRTLRALVIAINQVATIEMTARAYEPAKLLSGTYDLLRIDTVTHFADGQELATVVWCDRTGDSLKTRTDMLGKGTADGEGLESFRATKAEALEQTAAGGFDLGRDLSVKVARPLPKPYADDPHATRQIRYRVCLEGGDPAAVFVAGPSQQVRSIDPHTAEVTVYAIRPGLGGGNAGARQDPPTDGDLAPNNLIQSDDAKVVALAQQAVAQEGANPQHDPWQTAVRLEGYVHRLIVKKDFSQAFATAAEVAEHPEGDCTEHAVLLAALCRAQKIPARVAIGLVYLAGQDTFAYHMWTEVYVDRRWTAIDATLARGGIGAAHLKLAHSNLQGASAYSAFLPVLKVAGRLSIDVEEAR